MKENVVVANRLQMASPCIRDAYAKVVRGRQGFTLVELSIVLVVIGLIIGSVLTGQQIAENARITKALNDLQAYQAQFQTYAQNYGALPGDDANATQRFSSSGLQAGGNGNGVIGGGAFDAPVANGASESLLVWAHLRAAGLLRNQVTSGNSTAVQPPNPFNGQYGVQDGAFRRAYFTTPVLCMGAVPLNAAVAIDARLDDGISDKGSIQASTGGVDGAAAANYNQDANYTLCMRL